MSIRRLRVLLKSILILLFIQFMIEINNFSIFRTKHLCQ